MIATRNVRPTIARKSRYSQKYKSEYVITIDDVYMQVELELEPEQRIKSSLVEAMLQTATWPRRLWREREREWARWSFPSKYVKSQ